MLPDPSHRHPEGRVEVLMTCMLRNRRQEAPRGRVDLLEDGRVVWHDTHNVVRWWHEDFLAPITKPNASARERPTG